MAHEETNIQKRAPFKMNLKLSKGRKYSNNLQIFIKVHVKTKICLVYATQAQKTNNSK